MEQAGKYIKKSIWQNVYPICLIMIGIIHFFFVTLLDFLKDEDNKGVSSSEYVTMLSLLLLEWVLIAFQCKILYKYIFLTDIKPIFCLYLSKILAFADIYLLIFKIHAPQFDHPNNVLIKSANYRDISMILLNYSASIQTLTGISAVAPRKVASEFFSALQVLCFGIGYSVFILSIAVLRFAQPDMISNTQINSPLNIIDNNNDNSKQSKPNDLLLKENVNNEKSLNSISSLPKPRITFIKNYAKYAKIFYRYMLLILFCIQTPRIIIMYFICDLHCDNNAILNIGIIFDSILLFLCIICGLIRMRLIRRLGIHINISLIGLIRSYLTVLIQFGILYFDVWILTKNNKKSAFNINVIDADVNNFFSMFGHFLYFSTSTFTNVGAEAAISTHEPTGQILNCIQMLIGVIFHTTVFGVSLLDISSHRYIDTQKFVESHTITNISNLKETNSLRNVGLIQREIKEMVVEANTPKNDKIYEYPSINSLSINHNDH